LYCYDKTIAACTISINSFSFSPNPAKSAKKSFFGLSLHHLLKSAIYKNNNLNMIFKYIQSNLDVADDEFDLIYSKKIKAVSEMHFTPVKIAKMASAYLAAHSGAKVLDIGSGAGKFCMIGSAHTTGYFYGVEQRKNLCSIAKRISRHYKLTNLQFIHSNILDIEFKTYNAFYFFNSFYENISRLGAIDNQIPIHRNLYEEYSCYVREQLDTMPMETKLVTYYSFQKEVPDSYKVQFVSLDEKLKFWKKMY
jgi:hypothetical protein